MEPGTSVRWPTGLDSGGWCTGTESSARRSGWRGGQESGSRSTGHDWLVGHPTDHQWKLLETEGPGGPAGVPDRRPAAGDLAGHRRGSLLQFSGVWLWVGGDCRLVV